MIRTISKYLLNRYILTLAAFVVWMLFFDRNNFFEQRERKNELDELNRKISFYEGEIAEGKKALRALQNDPATLEKFAREQYFMRRDNEDVFVMPQNR